MLDALKTITEKPELDREKLDILMAFIAQLKPKNMTDVIKESEYAVCNYVDLKYTFYNQILKRCISIKGANQVNITSDADYMNTKEDEVTFTERYHAPTDEIFKLRY